MADLAEASTVIRRETLNSSGKPVILYVYGMRHALNRVRFDVLLHSEAANTCTIIRKSSVNSER